MTKKKEVQVRSLKTRSFPVVGLGGSAGSFTAFEKFFTHMPANSGMAFIIVMHLNANHKSNVAELIQNYTAMPVIEAGDGVTINPDHIYVIPPNKDMGMHNGRLLLLSPAMAKGYRMPIDYFFQSLAEDQWNKAVGIIFSGMGSDGETGMRMIKEKLGMAMVQDPDTAQYNSMPKSAISTNLIDYVVSPEEMPVKLIQYLRHPALSEEPNEQVISDTRNSNAFQKILMLLRSQTGHDFSLYKKNTITRRVDRRLAFHQLPDYSGYVMFLRENPHEINVLFNELLIGVTKFFRDAGAFEAVKAKLYPLLRKKPDGEPIRVWIPGCSTGEEAYTIAMLLAEFLDTLKEKKHPKVQIFATDLDADSVEHARQGFYFENIAADVSKKRLDRFFSKKNNGYLAKKELREMIVFAQHNIIKDAPFTRLDLLSCRNLMIYLTTELQKKIIPVFHYSLNQNGLLLLGPAETVGGFTDMFQPVDGKWKLSQRKEGSSVSSRMIDFPFNISSQGTGLIRQDHHNPALKKTSSLQDFFYKVLLENYTPASVLLNEKGDILYINGKTGRFLELSPGEAVMNIYRMAREELKYALSNAIHQARAQKGIVTIQDIKLKNGKQLSLVTIKVVYMEDMPMQDAVIVIFEDGGMVRKPDPKGKKGTTHPAIIEEMEKELSYTKQQLHTTIEQMETSLEELKSTNEELQSTNEELQSTNEESLTTKEEMQSLNEELMTINMQYQSKGEELTQLNNDMKNLLDSTETATIFLDNTLDILRFTPQVKKLFNVISSDVGRSITHIVSNFEHTELENDIRGVIENLRAKELTVKTKKGEWYHLRIMPYRTLDNFISGAVLTFNPISTLKELETRLEFTQRSAKVLVDAHQFPAILLDERMHITIANSLFLKAFKLKEKEITGQALTQLVHDKWETTKLNRFLKQCQHSKISVELEHDFLGTGIKNYKISATPVPGEKDKAAMVFMIFEELHGKKRK
jgi:two-component system CheB/CheR fusion protein